MKPDFYDTLESRHPQAREAALMRELPRQLAHAKANTPAYASILADVQPHSVASREALARLPVTRKQELLARQRASVPGEPFGGFSALMRNATTRRIYASPGPIYEPEGGSEDWWRAGRALYAAGFRIGDLVHNSFSYHMTPGAFIMESGAFAVGCTMFPAGTGQTELQLQAIAQLRPTAYTGTPSFLRILLERAQEARVDISSIKKAVTSGEALPPSLQAWFAERGVDVYQSYLTGDVGLIAYETASREGLVVDEGVIVEIVQPGTGEPVAEGEVGEVVVTTLNPDYPLIRFATGDLSAVLPGTCATGRTNMRIRGWLGRADQTTKVRGMFVHPGQVADIVKRFPDVRRARLVVTGEMANDSMVLRVEASHASEDLRARIAEAIRDVTKLRGDVEIVAPGSLPQDGKAIEDARSYR